MRVAPTRLPHHRPARAGFTLVEILTVIAIIGILAGLTFGIGVTIGSKARKGKAEAQMLIIGAALEKFKARYGDYPLLSEHPAGTPPGASALTDTTVGNAGTAGANGYELFRYLMGRQGIGRATGTAQRITLTRGGVEKFGPSFLSLEGIDLERKSSTGAPYHVPMPEASATTADPDIQNALIDPWGSRYVYFYKDQDSLSTWTARSYILLSAGPDKVINTTINTAGEFTLEGDDLVKTSGN